MSGQLHQPKNQLQAKQLRCIRNERILFDDLSFSFSEQTCLHLVGANGSGKSTLLRILCGLTHANNGEVLWNKKRIKNNRHFTQNTAYIGHKEGIKNELSCIENLRHYQHLNCDTSDKTHSEERLDDCLNQLDLLALADQPTQYLSFGQRRRLIFARLLLKEYTLWLLDEPFTGIDQQGRDTIEQCCLRHLKKNGSIILSNHQSLCHSILAPYLKEVVL